MMLDGRREQLASLGPDDVLIITDLGDIGAASFDRAEDAVAPGEAAARKHFERLVSLDRPDDEDPEKLVSRLESRRIRSITIETDTSLSVEVLRARLLTKEGDAFEPDKIEEDLSRIYGLGLFETVTYDVEPAEEDVTLHILAKENSAGKDYLRFGLNLQTDFGNESSYDVGVSYTVPAINELNGEWRSTAVIGERLGATTELYQPLDPAASVFLRPSVSVLDRDVNVFQDRRKIAETRVLEARATFAAGLNLNDDLAVFSRITRGFGSVREVTGTDTITEGGFDTDRKSVV
jgi:NTE family protein